MESSILTQVVLPLSLFLIMFGMGLSLVVADFARVVRHPKAVAVGLTGQMILLPIVGFAIASSMNLSPGLAMGLMLLAACPGGTSSNLVAYLAKGDVALSITLTAFSSVLTIISIPLILSFSMDTFLQQSQTIPVPVTHIITVLVAITIVPVSLGMMVRRWKETWAFYLEPKLNKFSSFFLVALVVAIIVEQQEMLMSVLSDVWISTGALNLTTMGAAALAAVVLKLNSKQTTSLTVEVGIQNGALAILLATTVLENSEFAVPAAIYSLVMYLTGGALILYRKRAD